MFRKSDANSKPVYRTGGEKLETESGPGDRNAGEAPPAGQVLRLRLETKSRGGKAVTVISGVSGSRQQVEDLSRELKTLCGAGGTLRPAGDGTTELEIQGDHRPKIAEKLRKKGFTVKGA